MVKPPPPKGHDYYQMAILCTAQQLHNQQSTIRHLNLVPGQDWRSAQSTATLTLWDPPTCDSSAVRLFERTVFGIGKCLVLGP